jgi:hypothetical protein
MDNVWHKPNPMPESVTDRPTKAHEYIFMLTKSVDYFYDAEAVKEQTSGTAHARGDGVNPKALVNAPGRVKQNASFSAAVTKLVSHRNRRSVWTFTTKPYPGAHFATFPPDLPELCIQAGTSEYGCCARCAAPFARVVEAGEPRRDQQRACGGDADGEYHGQSRKWEGKNEALPERRRYVGFNERWRRRVIEQNPSDVKARILAGMVERRTVGWRPTCACGGAAVQSVYSRRLARHPWYRAHWQRRILAKWGAPAPATVLDPFGGTATTGEVALHLGRSAIIIELNPTYANTLARPRLEAAAPLFAREATA